jgi:hypothetical protein
MFPGVDMVAEDARKRAAHWGARRAFDPVGGQALGGPGSFIL